MYNKEHELYRRAKEGKEGLTRRRTDRLRVKRSSKLNSRCKSNLIYGEEDERSMGTYGRSLVECHRILDDTQKTETNLTL